MHTSTLHMVICSPWSKFGPIRRAAHYRLPPSTALPVLGTILPTRAHRVLPSRKIHLSDKNPIIHRRERQGPGQYEMLNGSFKRVVGKKQLVCSSIEYDILLFLGRVVGVPPGFIFPSASSRGSNPNRGGALEAT